MQSGDLDLMANGDIRPEDYVGFKRLADRGALRLVDAGVGIDPNLLWFNLSPARTADPRRAWLRQHGVSAGGVLRGRPRRDRQHRPLGCRGPNLRADHSRQPDVVSPRCALRATTIRRRRGSSLPRPASPTETATACSRTTPASRRSFRS